MPEYPIGIDTTKVDTEALAADAAEVGQTIDETKNAEKLKL